MEEENDMARLEGKTALVTGASRGIGRASVMALAREGAQVIVHYCRAKKEAEEIVTEITRQGGRAQAISGDMASPEGPHELAQKVRAIVGERLDILIANAGISIPASITETNVADFDQLFAVNVRAPYFLIQQLLPILTEGSSVIVTTSLAAHAAVEGISAYAMTKGALDTMVKHFALTLGERGIRVNSIAPGIVETDMSEFARSEQGRQYAMNMQALKRVAQPDDIGDVVAFLASNEARWITGHILHVDGGAKL
jgi:NAD(P)-dependent dehydrogenase (short-subunit alcohol dehydrogenase family)